MADIVTLTADPVLQSVGVTANPAASAHLYTCHCVFKSYSAATPIWTEVDVDFDTEVMPYAFFRTTVKDVVVATLLEAGYAPGEDFELPPIADTLEVWDPATNAPYP